jgi:hypothetical protein
MPVRKFERIALALLLLGGCAVVFGDCGLMGHAQAQQPAPPPPPVMPPTQAPIFNPSSPNTVQQPSYTPLAPTTPSATPSLPSTAPSSEVTPPANEQSQNTTARSEQKSFAKTRAVHRHRGFAESTLGSYYCGYSPCFRVYPSALYGYAAPAYGVVAPAPVYAASGLWWPGFYDYAPGQWGRGHPRYWGYWRRAGYHGD